MRTIRFKGAGTLGPALLALAVCSLLPSPAQAQDTHPRLDGWMALMSEADCTLDGTAPEVDATVGIAMAFEGLSVAAISNRTGIDLLGYVEAGNSLVWSDDPEGVAETLLAATAAGFDRAVSAAGADPEAFCALAQAIGSETLEQRAAGQAGKNGYYSPDQRLAQTLLTLHGCLSGAADGVFGPQSRAAWNRAVEQLAPELALDRETYPAPERILAFAALPFRALACRFASPTAGQALVGTAILRQATACATGADFWVSGVGAFLAAARTEPDALAATVGHLADLCPTEDIWQHVAMAAKLGVEAGLAMATDDEAAARLAWDVAMLGRDRTDLIEVPGYDVRLADGMFEQSVDLISRPETAAFGGWLLIATLADPTGFSTWFEPGEDFATAIEADTLPAALRDRLRAAYASSTIALRDPVMAHAAVEDALAGRRDAGEVALQLAQAVDAQISVQAEGPDSDLTDTASAATYAGGLRVKLALRFAGIQPLMQLARLVGARPELGGPLAIKAGGVANFALATVLLEGYSGQPRTDALLAAARRHMQAAAQAGIGIAALRMAQMTEQGLGMPADPLAARTYYLAAAEDGQPEALIALARQAEAGLGQPADPAMALDLYARAVGISGAKRPTGADVATLRAWLTLREGVFAGPDAAALEDRIQRRFLEGDAWDLSWQAYDIGLAFLDTRQALPADPARAVDWLRIAVALEERRDAAGGDDTASTGPSQTHVLLAQIVLAFPELADRPPPAGLEMPRLSPEALLAGSPLLSLLAGGTPDAATYPWLACEDAASERIGECVEIAARAATGGFGAAALRDALDWLAARAGEEAIEMQTHGRLGRSNQDYDPSRTAAASAAHAEVLAFWGDWRGAIAAAAPFGTLPFTEHFGPRQDQFRRMTSRWLDGKAPVSWPDFLAVVQAFATRGDPQSIEILDVVGLGEVLPRSTVGPDLATAREAFAIAEPLGTGSPGMAHAARVLAPLEAAAGNRTRAIGLELMALNTDLAKAQIDQILYGTVPADMTRICGWSHASERLFDMGETGLALSLAELAVNRLQVQRGRLVGLPESLQLCFRDQVSDHYRWLAGLYLDAGRLAEVDRVLMMLKDFETYRFVRRDPDFGAEATGALAPAADASKFIQAIAPIAPTVTGQSMRRRELLLQKKRGELSPGDTAELARLDATLEAAAQDREAVVDQIVGSIADAHEVQDLTSGKSVKRLLRAMSDKGRAAALQYVVLDGRIGILLTTPVSQRAFLQDRLGDAALTADDLTAAVAAFRADLSRPGSNPLPLAQDMHDLLFPPDLRAELAAGGIERLVVSLDGPLRYIPVAALHDGTHWLAEDFVLSHVTGGAVSDGSAEISELAGFGVTRSVDDLPALPGVAEELAGIAGPQGAALPGTVWLDRDFNRDTLTSALVFGDGFTDDFGVLHLASHFKLGPTEAESFLLMGDGTRLSMADLRTGLGADLDFSEVGLLTLSACETGFGGLTDGTELASFAAVAQDAGAGTVLATLWPVNDRSIAVMMREFYRLGFPKDGVPADPALALTLVQRGQIASSGALSAAPGRSAVPLKPVADAPEFSAYSHPFHWAAIVVLEGAG
ncbi:MAG: CHAT domain-containing protein [Rhodobacteraceae bacterium]|jgi:CHAT domain-containing protein/TPR repeat protein|nr:CHAT domain-containing protein [Paracoccaceae bacterium]